MPAGASFVSARLRDDARVRIEAPGFGAGGANNPMAAMMGGMFGAMAQEGATQSEETQAVAHPMQGTFRITTDARILANNTDEGPQDGPGGLQTLTWDITPTTMTGPSVLLALNPSR